MIVAVEKNKNKSNVPVMNYILHVRCQLLKNNKYNTKAKIKED